MLPSRVEIEARIMSLYEVSAISIQHWFTYLTAGCCMRVHNATRGLAMAGPAHMQAPHDQLRRY